MKLEDLKPGLYRIKATVPNPNADRRTKGDWRKAPELPEGGIVSVVFQDMTHVMDEMSEAVIIEARPYRELAGAHYPNANALVLGSRTSKRGHKLSGEKTGWALLSVLEPYEPTNAEDALRAFNDQTGNGLSWREIALTLMAETHVSTLALFERIVADSPRGDDAGEWQKRHAELSNRAFHK